MRVCTPESKNAPITTLNLCCHFIGAGSNLDRPSGRNFQYTRVFRQLMHKGNKIKDMLESKSHPYNSNEMRAFSSIIGSIEKIFNLKVVK
jgi:hypothetical protein